MPERRSMSRAIQAATAAAGATLLAAGALAVLNAGPATGAVPPTTTTGAGTTSTTSAPPSTTTSTTATNTRTTSRTTTSTIQFCDPAPPDAVLASRTETSLTFTFTSHGDVCGNTGTTTIRLFTENQNWNTLAGQGSGSGKTGTITISGLTPGTGYYHVESGGGSPFTSGWRGPEYTAGTVTPPVCTPATNAGLALRRLPLPAGWTAATVDDINPSGTVLGNALAPTGITHAVTWSAAGVFTDLELLPGTTYVQGEDINASGSVIGYQGTNEGTSQAVIWRRGRVSVLKGPGGQSASVVAIADDGSAVGNFYAADGTWHGIRWDAAGRPALLPTLPGAATSSVSRGNHAGQAVGSSAVAGSTESHTVFWERSGRLVDLQTAPGGPSWVYPFDLSDGGTVILSEGYLWSRARGFRTLPLPAGATSAGAQDVNGVGAALGSASGFTTGPNSRIYRWSATGTPQELPLLAGRQIGTPVGLNASGVAIGTTSLFNAVPHGTRWGRSGAAEDLGGVTSCDRSEPVAINDAGVIAGTIRPAGAASNANVPVVWRPVS